MNAKFEVFLIACGLTVFNTFAVLWMLDLFEGAQSGAGILIILGAIIVVPAILLNIFAIVSLLLPWSDNPQPEYSKQDYKRKKSDLKKSLGWRIFKEIIDIID